jgi:HPt (histidine-containing phosphotransfer) domain-containing protein
MESTVPVLDEAALGRLRQLEALGEEGLVAELVGDFLTGAPGRLARLEALAAAGDRPGLEAEAHRLAGACGAVCAERLRREARALELAAPGEEAGALLARARALAALLPATREALEAAARGGR